LTLGDISGRILNRLEVDPTDPAWQFVATAATNEGQRIFSFLSLCLESTVPFAYARGLQFYNMLTYWPDWFLPLRVRLSAASGNPKLRPQSLYQMAANDPNFLSNTGVPAHYGTAGWDLLFFDRNPSLSGQLLITYARCPVPLVNPTDVPEILEADHEALVSYGIARLRANEGGEELANSSALASEFIEAAQSRFEEVKGRAMAQGYDWPIAELNLELRQNPLKKKS
jgi:hypothetical protein